MRIPLPTHFCDLWHRGYPWVNSPQRSPHAVTPGGCNPWRRCDLLWEASLQETSGSWDEVLWIWQWPHPDFSVLQAWAGLGFLLTDSHHLHGDISALVNIQPLSLELLFLLFSSYFIKKNLLFASSRSLSFVFCIHHAFLLADSSFLKWFSCSFFPEFCSLTSEFFYFWLNTIPTVPSHALIPNACAHREGGGYCELRALPWNGMLSWGVHSCFYLSCFKKCVLVSLLSYCSFFFSLKQS